MRCVALTTGRVAYLGYYMPHVRVYDSLDSRRGADRPIQQRIVTHMGATPLPSSFRKSDIHLELLGKWQGNCLGIQIHRTGRQECGDRRRFNESLFWPFM